MAGPAESESERHETIHAVPTVHELIGAAGVLAVAALMTVVGGVGLGVLVVTLALLAAALWRSYAMPAAAQPGPSAAASYDRAATASDSRRSWAPALPRISAPALSVDRASLLSLSVLSAAVSVLGIVAAGVFLFVKDRAVNPPGFFADEAEIGLQSLKLLHGEASTSRIPFFYHHLEYDHLGTLALFGTAPFVGLAGLTQSAVRDASVFWIILACVVIYFTLRQLKIPYAAVAVLAMMVSPIFILISRINFGHAPSFAAMSAGFLLWVKARPGQRRWLALLAGVLIGLSAYGAPSYYVAAPLLLLAIGLVELAYNRLAWRAYGSLLYLAIGSMLILLPVPYRALTYPPFLDRYRDKTGTANHGLDRVSEWLHAYPQYFNFDMLFVHGAGDWRTRHYYPGAAFLFPSLLIFLLIGFISLLIIRGDANQRFIWPMALVVLFYPIPDVMSQGPGDPPYSVSMVWAAIAIPFLAGYGFVGVRKLLGRYRFSRATLLYAAAVLLFSVVSVAGFWRGAFANYPNVAADYWGWQFGAKAATDYFKAHATEYDEFYLSGEFNAAFALADFFSHDSAIAGRTSTGSTELVDLTKRQLFAVRPEKWSTTPGSQYPERSYLRIVGTIPYPDGSPALYLVTVDPAFLRLGQTATPAG